MDERTGTGGPEGLLSNRHVTHAFLIGIALIVTGFAAEAWVPQLIDFINSFRPGYSGPEAAQGGTGADHGPLGLIVLLLKELGVAFLVAGIIAWAIEKQARELDNERARKLREEVASDAIFAIYGLRHQKDFVKAVVEENLRQMIVRENLELKYKLRDLTVKEARKISPANHEDALQRFVILDMNSTYDFRNVAGRPEDVDIRYVINLLQGEGARHLAELRHVSIGGEDVTAKFSECRRPAEGGAELCYEWTHPRLAPDTPLRVIINARCVRGRSDKEVWGSFFPTMGDVKLTLEVLAGMRFGAKSLSNAVLDEDHYEPGEVSKSWTMKGPLLRYSAMFVWWRKPEDDAEDVVSAAAEFAEPESELAPPARRSGAFRRLLDIVSGK